MLLWWWQWPHQPLLLRPFQQQLWQRLDQWHHGVPTEPRLDQFSFVRFSSQWHEFPDALIPEVRFTDITSLAGIDFVHTNGASGDKLLPEAMGGGVAFLGDGPWGSAAAGVPAYPTQLLEGA